MTDFQLDLMKMRRSLYIQSKMEEQANYGVSHVAATENANPLNEQVGGDHYKKCRIQPVEYIHANGLGSCEGSIIKYVTRHRDKNGKNDLLKARHFIDLLISLEYPDK